MVRDVQYFGTGKRLKITQVVIGEQKISTGMVQVVDGKILAIGTLKGALYLPRSPAGIQAQNEYKRILKRLPR